MEANGGKKVPRGNEKEKQAVRKKEGKVGGYRSRHGLDERLGHDL